MWWFLCYLFLFAVSAIPLLVTFFIVWGNSYWKKRGFDSPPATFFYEKFLRAIFIQKSKGDVDVEVYKYLSTKKIGGVMDLVGPSLWIVDPDLMRNVFIKDFDHFVDRLSIDFGNEAPYGRLILANLEGQHWKDIRSVITPSFTSGKIKQIFPLVCETADQLKDYFSAKSKHGDDVEIKDAYGRFTMDVIASSAFGIQCNSIQNPDAPFAKLADTMFHPGAFGFFVFIMTIIFPRSMKVLGKIFSLPNADTILYSLANVVKATIAERERSGIVRKDFLQLLLNAMKGKEENETESDHAIGYNADAHHSSSASSKSVLDEPTLIAQCILFFVAGYETTATTLAFATYELSLNPDLQEKLYEELQKAVDQHDGQITYDGIMGIELLEKVLNETLRLHSPAPRMNRKCTKDYQIPGTEQVIRKGTLVIFPSFAVHRDEKHFPNPTKFDPERFSPEEKAKRHPYVFQPFGHGPRNCIGQVAGHCHRVASNHAVHPSIGMRFALMEAKAALAMTVLNFRLRISKRTDVPMKYSISSMIMTARNGIWLRLEPRIN